MHEWNRDPKYPIINTSHTFFKRDEITAWCSWGKVLIKSHAFSILSLNLFNQLRIKRNSIEIAFES